MGELGGHIEKADSQNWSSERSDIKPESAKVLNGLFSEDFREGPERLKPHTEFENISLDSAEIYDNLFQDDFEAAEGDSGWSGDNPVETEQKETPEEHEGLTDEEKDIIKKETGWSDAIIDAIGSMEEYEIYKNAGLKEGEIAGKPCLVRSDINWDQKDSMGRSNQERAEQGLPPLDKDGKPIELHHIGQHADSPLAELTMEEHRGGGNDAILHDKQKDSEIDRTVFARERSEHWTARAEEGGNR